MSPEVARRVSPGHMEKPWPLLRDDAVFYPKTVKVMRSFGIRVLPNSYVPTRSVTVHLIEPVKCAPVERVTPGPESLKPSFVERSLTVIT